MTDTGETIEHVPALGAGSLTLQRMSLDELRGELAATLTVTARHLVHLAGVWRELERRGEDLSHLRSGLWSYMPMIARGDIRPELIVRYAGFRMLLARVAQLSLADQDRLIRDDHVTVVVDAGSRLVERTLPLSRIKAVDLPRVVRDRIVTPTEQREEIEMRRAAGVDRPPGAKALTRTGRKAGRLPVSVTLSLTPEEVDALKMQAERAGVPIAALVAQALATAGLLSSADASGQA